jgi:hypothetical protein
MFKKTDPLTGEQFVGNNKQRFACAANRIKYYNNRNIELRKKMNAHNKPLHKNYCILRELMQGKKESSFHKQFLLGKGYCFTVFTNYRKHGDKSYPAVYDYILFDAGNDIIKIISNE